METTIVMQNKCNKAFIRVHCVSNNQNLNWDTSEKTTVNLTLEDSGRIPLTIHTLKRKDRYASNTVLLMIHSIITTFSESF